jgi:uncharacterized membrane protein YbhN (UPF0104 family)
VKRLSLSWGARLLVSALVLALLFRLVPFRELAAAVGRVPPRVWLVVVGAFLLAHAASACKWRLLMLGGPVPHTRTWMTAHFAGLTANLFLPGIAGGDVVRAGYLIRQGTKPEQAAAAGVVDRIIDIAALLLLASTGAALTYHEDPQAGRIIVYIAGSLALAGGIGITVLFILSRRGHTGIVGRLVGALGLLLRRPDRLAVCAAASVTIQAVLIALNSVLGRAVGVEAPLSAWLTAWPMAKLVALAPISLAGLGVREAALVAFMQPLGGAPGPVMAAGLLWESVLVSGGVVGWLATLAAPGASVDAAPLGPSS